MCAIAGLLEMVTNEGILRKMLDTMKHRGPDGAGIYTSNICTLLHSRLAIIDPEGGSQPMEADYGNERYVLVYNGELYNARALRRELKELGHEFRDQSDTEVVLRSYVQWGERCVDRFNGIFAFAVWEECGKRLFMARDRIGVKPLFYQQTGNGLIFSSEIKTILTHPACKARLDREGAAQIVLLGPGRKPGSGIFAGILELEPGCYGFWQDGKLTYKRYWQLTDGIHTDSLPETVEKVRFLVLDAIRGQMISDVPIGTFLSGGLDSSIISAVCAEEMEKQGQGLHTFSVDYSDNDRFFVKSKFQPEGDNHYIRLMQNAIGSQHHWSVLTPEDLIRALESATEARDLPGMADVDFSLLVFCADVRKYVKVALSGECADEIFGGYPWYRDREIRNQEGFPWAQNTKKRCRLLRPEICPEGESFVMDCYLDTCHKSDILPETPPEERRMKEMMNLNFCWFMQTLLDRKDRMSMHSGLEVRVPFCDWRIAEYLYRVPWHIKDLEGREKGLLRRAVEGILPDQVLYRKKNPYPKTFDPRYTQLVECRMKMMLEDAELPIWHLLDRDEAGKYMSGESSWPWYGQLMGRPQTLAWMLQVDHWLRRYKPEFLF